MKRFFALAVCSVLFSASLGCNKSSAPAKAVGKAAPKNQLLKVTGQIEGLEFSPDGHTLAVSWDGGKGFELWDVNKRQKIGAIGSPSSMMFGASFDSTGENLAVSRLDSIGIWNLKHRKFTSSFPHANRVACFVGNTKLWIDDARPYDPMHQVNSAFNLLSVPTGETLSRVVFPVDASNYAFIARPRIAVFSDGANLWEWSTAKKRMQFHVKQSVPERAVNQPFLAFVLGGKAIAWSYELGGFQIRSVQTGRLLWQPNYAGIYDIAAPAQGNLLATAHQDHLVRLWDLQKHKLVRVLRAHQAEVFHLAFSPDGRTLASGDYHGQVLIWRIK